MKKVQLFSTLNPYPFWAGSESFWFDFISDEVVRSVVRFGVALAESPVTKSKGAELNLLGVETTFYKHFNNHFIRRNVYRVLDRGRLRNVRTLPWYDRILRYRPDLVWFNVAALADLKDLSYAVEICKDLRIPYWIILQHGYEDFFLSSEQEVNLVTVVAISARRLVFVSDRNRKSLERSIGQRLDNSFRSVNAMSEERMLEANGVAGRSLPRVEGTARFLNLGRFSPQDKAQHLLLEAFAGREWEKRDWQLTFVGVSDFGRFYLERLIAYYQIKPNRISIRPHTSDVFREIAESDVLLMPSRSEGMPFSRLEAMACGRPSLGTPVGGIPELVIDGETGWLAMSVDTRGVADALERMWEQRDRWIEYGKNALKNIREKFHQNVSHSELLKNLRFDIGV